MEMSYAAFVAAYEAGQVKAKVNKNAAVKIASSPLLPLQNRAAHTLWSWITFLLVPFSIYLIFFRTWWLGLLILIFVVPAIWRGVTTTAQQWVLEFSLKDPQFYETATAIRALVVEAV